MLKSIHEINFEDVPDTVIQQKMELYNKATTEKEKRLLKRSFMSSCEMKTLADNNIMLYRVAKSSAEVAKKSNGSKRFIAHKPNSTVEDIYEEGGLSLTPSENLITCLIYGDIIVEVPFEGKRLEENDILDMRLYCVARGTEYLADKILTANIYSLSDPNTLKKAIKLSSDQYFQARLNDTLFSLEHHFMGLGLTETAKYWKLIKSRYNELIKFNPVGKISILRTELDSILMEM